MLRLAADLKVVGADFAVVGGLAVGARLGGRFTRDVDVAVSVEDDSAADRILGYFIRYGYRPQADLSHHDTGRLRTMRLVPPIIPNADPEEGRPIADFLFATSGIEREAVAEASVEAVFPIRCSRPLASRT